MLVHSVTVGWYVIMTALCLVMAEEKELEETR